jgi:demethylmenaquinone methyltransferase/2-methoxy-6-polyprenyl-1,4-benzoquinol methylase
VAAESDVARLYDRTAWYWDSPVHHIAYRRAYFQLFERLQEDRPLAAAERPSRVLDCGIGTGLFSEALLRATATPFDVYGIDLSVQMLARARSRLQRWGSRVHLQQGDVSALPLGDGEMDLVIGALVLEHVPDPLLALREIVRVLRAGALMVLVTTRPSAPDSLFRALYRYGPVPPESLVRWMEEAGLHDIQSHRLTGFARWFACARTGRKGLGRGAA